MGLRHGHRRPPAGAAGAERRRPRGAGPARERRDINGQICVSPDGLHVVTGEDTVFPPPGGGDGGDGEGSHDPRIAGWGSFDVAGSTLGQIRMRQVGKLSPEWTEPGYAGDPDNYGCGFLDPGRLFTTPIGDTLPGEPANGQLFLWFGPFTAGYTTAATPNGTRFRTGTVGYCESDRTLATAGGIAIDGDEVYVASNGPDDAGNAGGVWRYTADWPASP